MWNELKRHAYMTGIAEREKVSCLLLHTFILDEATNLLKHGQAFVSPLNMHLSLGSSEQEPGGNKQLKVSTTTKISFLVMTRCFPVRAATVPRSAIFIRTGLYRSRGRSTTGYFKISSVFSFYLRM